MKMPGVQCDNPEAIDEMASQILDNLIEKGLAKPMICVMPNGNPGQQAAKTQLLEEKAYDRNDPQFANLYVTSIVKDIIPYIESHYRVIANPEARAVSGLSMGGGHTLAVTNLFPGTFDYICPLSIGVRGEAADIDNKDINIIVATGNHRANTFKELESMVGKDILNRYKVINHNCFDENALEMNISGAVVIKMTNPFLSNQSEASAPYLFFRKYSQLTGCISGIPPHSSSFRMRI